MKTQLLSPAATADLIRGGATMIIAGAEQALRALPVGDWIGGTSHYFLTPEGGCQDDENLMVTTIESASDSLVRQVATPDLPSLAEGRFENGFSLILIPCFSEAHRRFAIEGPGFPRLFEQPLMGWISGTRLDDIGRVTPKVVDGSTGQVLEDGALLMHVELPASRMAEIGIVNLYEQSRDPARCFVFEETGFAVRTARVEGRQVDLAEYLRAEGIDTALPLVADYAGAMVNVSLQEIDESGGLVHFYAPVVAGVEYRLAEPLRGDYSDEFLTRASGDGTAQLSCNCILNYVRSDLEGRITGSYSGPATFGEIAYMLLNQTMVRLELKTVQAHSVA